ncbi:DJ-1/PfpI family protein [Embleya sp. AB8]|uniref:DJ-1/PfpI family protein n=1 Tax=Embleya sp. AB8 TaxID=3156304 RepID=UPI003C765900
MNAEHENSRRRVLRGAVATAMAGGILAAGASGAAGAADAVDAAEAADPADAADAPGTARVRVAILLYDGFTALDAVGPYEILCRVPGVRVTTVAHRAGRIRTDTGQLALIAERPLAAVRTADVLLVPGGGSGSIAATKDRELLDWIRRIHRTTTWTTSVCTGSLILGAAGLLRGLPATTHWASRTYLTTFGAIYTPGRYVDAGKIITAAGVSAGIDMALHLASRLSTVRVAQAMQLATEYDPDPPYDTGTPEKADPELQALALKLIADAAGQHRLTE